MAEISQAESRKPKKRENMLALVDFLTKFKKQKEEKDFSIPIKKMTLQRRKVQN